MDVRPETMNRIENHFVETENGISGITFKRAYLKDVIPYIGGQWMILTRECCEFICNSGEAKNLKIIIPTHLLLTNLFSNSFDEHFI